MGGNALKKTTTRRYNKDEYVRLKDEVIGVLKELLPNARIDDVKAYGDKSSFGDLDVVVEDIGDRERLEKKLLSLGVYEIVYVDPLESSVWSMGWNDFQVDLIFQPPEDYDFACHYFAYNDLGNLIGRIARRFDLKFGHDGLSYMLLDDSQKVADVYLTKDFYQALEFLGYSSERYKQGFNSLDDIFEFVATSHYYDPHVFLLENRNHKARTRDAKRPNYRAFLEFAKQNMSGDPSEPIGKDEALDMAREAFPDFAREIDHLIKKHRQIKEAKPKFNGKVVSGLTGLKGIPMGEFLNHLKDQYPESHESFEDWLVEASPDDLSKWIKSEYKGFSPSEESEQPSNEPRNSL